MKKINILTALFSGIVLCTVVHAESLTLTTYYPAPFGAYDRLRLVPRGNLAGVCDIGTLYVETPDQLKYCKDNGSGIGEWGTMGGVWTQSGDDLFPNDYSNPDLYVGIGTNTPQYKLHIIDDGSIYATGLQTSGPAMGQPSVFLWWPQKGALRVGRDPNGLWNDPANFGEDGTVAIGVDVRATGETAAAFGWATTASGTNSMAIGSATTASQYSAFAGGEDSTASGDRSFAFGANATASGAWSFSVGQNTIASGMHSYALGEGIEARGNGSVGVALSNQSGTIITNNNTMAVMGGNVGIGTVSPSTRLEVSGGAIKATGGLIIETRTDDPATPANGQMWVRTDLP